MIKVKYIDDNNELILAGEVKTPNEALKLDYHVWKDLKKETMFEYKEYLHSPCPEADFIENEKEISEWVENINSLTERCLEFND